MADSNEMSSISIHDATGHEYGDSHSEPAFRQTPSSWQTDRPARRGDAGRDSWTGEPAALRRRAVC